MKLENLMELIIDVAAGLINTMLCRMSASVSVIGGFSGSYSHVNSGWDL
ncbi:MAG: hypothetical protein HQK99_02820 [Nitrospirae bacterium]|nr:hypothetical protein [Nitrospirota bacterium]